MAKYWTTEMVKRVADRCLTFMVILAYLKNIPSPEHGGMSVPCPSMPEPMKS